ncbi:hypothetical protein PG990_000384 [Apiospora arundinis]|uniref:Proteophosphoglycan 5 n=1 Tax=Apiospora arundinis TaxID=335852 RepID=A0ABR2I016_9PEZI
MHSSPHPKNTPGRRRPGRNGNSQKNYASENDAASYRQVYSDSPSTPQKLAAGDALAAQNSQTTNSKQRKHSHKGRNKNGAASPGLANGNSVNKERHSPSFPPNQIPAFAGATFHHSPAPSALPIPSFLARTSSAPDSPSQKKPSTTGPSQEPSPPTTDSEEDGLGSPPLPVPRNEESPLEFFFKAQRAEKSGTARRASSANINAVPPGPFSPPHDSPKECQTVPRVATLPQQKRPAVGRMPSSGISSTELDGTPGKSLGPAFSTPYSERIKAARPSNGFAPATPTNARTSEADRSDALKRYLFSGGKGSPQQPQTPPRQQPASTGATQAPPKLPRGMFPASVLNGGGARAPQVQSPPSNNSQSSDQMRFMEDSLRRLLKMDSTA